MSWNLFLDDERLPPRDDREWAIARSCTDAIQLIRLKGSCPSYISFDHDLGAGETGPYPDGMSFANWLVESDLDSGYNFIPSDFSFYVHSQNPVGRGNIEGILNNYLRFRQQHLSSVKLPTSVEEAQMMSLVSEAYFKCHSVKKNSS